MACSECQAPSSYFKEDFSDGSYVCTRCGFVISDMLIDNRPVHDESRIVTGSSYDNIDFNDAFTYFHGMCGHLSISEDIAHKAFNIFEKLQTHIRVRDNRQILYALAFYMATLPRFNHQTICTLFSVFDIDKFRNLLKLANKSMPGSMSKNQSRFKKYIMVPGQTQNIIDKIIILEEKVRTLTEFASKKPTKLDAVIAFYVMAYTMNFKLDKQKYCEKFEISITTLNKHIKTIKINIDF